MHTLPPLHECVWTEARGIEAYEPGPSSTGDPPAIRTIIVPEITTIGDRVNGSGDGLQSRQETSRCDHLARDAQVEASVGGDESQTLLLHVRSVCDQLSKMRAAICARVSTLDQTVDNQLLDLRRYIEARGWTLINEYVDVISGAKDRRPGLDDLVRDARRRKFDTVLVWKLDRLGRSLRHLVLLMEELQQLGITLVSLGEGLDLSTPAGRLQAGLLAALWHSLRENVFESGLYRVCSGQGPKANAWGDSD